MNWTRAPLMVVLAVAPVACLRLNPAFGVDAEDGGASVGETSAASTGAMTATTGAGSSGSTSDASTSGVQPTSDGSTTAATTTGAPDTGETTAGGSTAGTTAGSTGDVQGMFELPAAAGACVFVSDGDFPQHGGPGECSADADAINNTALAGLMMVDVSVNNMAGKLRPARPYLRFDIPAKFGGGTVVSATLYVQVADGVTMLPQSGELWLTEPFAAADLEVTAPTLKELLAADQGEVQPDQWIAWVVPPALIQPGEALFLALQPTHDKGVMLRGASTEPGAPYLAVTIQ